MELVILLLFVLLSLGIAYWFLTRNHDHWQKQNVPCIPDPLPGFGHMLPVIALRENMSTFAERLYRYGQEQGDASMVGFHYVGRPGILVRDPKLVKAVLQTNFPSFRNNSLQLNEHNDPVLAKHPFVISDPARWKEHRLRITAQLSSRNLRGLFAIILSVCSELNAFTDRKIKENSADYASYECELKKYFLRCTGEVVANAAFAIQGQSFEDSPDRLSFATIAKTIFESTTLNGVKQTLLFYLPAVGDLLGLSFLQKRTDAYFRENVKAAIERRRRENSLNPPNDFLQCCIETCAADDIDSIVSNVIRFYVDVYDTSSTTLAVLFYHLSLNPEIQLKLRAHVRDALKGGSITYESLKSMQYLKQVIAESMRLLAPVGWMNKICTESITLTGSDGLSCRLEPGNSVLVSVAGLQLDEKYWPDPERFDPERFAPDTQAESNYDKYTCLPFGEGPRKCIGMQLALMLVKLVAASLILRYEMERSMRMRLPLEMDPTTFFTHTKDPLWARFKKLSVIDDNRRERASR